MNIKKYFQWLFTTKYKKGDIISYWTATSVKHVIKIVDVSNQDKGFVVIQEKTCIVSRVGNNVESEFPWSAPIEVPIRDIKDKGKRYASNQSLKGRM